VYEKRKRDVGGVLDERAIENSVFDLRERVVVVKGIFSILCKVYLLEVVFPRSLRWVVVKTCKL